MKKNLDFFTRGSNSYSTDNPFKWKSLNFKKKTSALSPKSVKKLTENQKYAKRFNKKFMQNTPEIKRISEVLTFKPLT